MYGSLYLITNKINGLQYVGKTYKSIENRWSDHIREARKFPNRKFYSDINKYGKNNFSVELVGMFAEKDLESYEQLLIKDLDTYNNGYNSTLGGEGKRAFAYTKEEVTNKYKELKSLEKTAEYYSACTRTISNLIDVKLNLRPNKVAVVYNSIQFDSCYDCAKYLLDNNLITTVAHIDQIAFGISRASSGVRKSYLGLKFSRI